MSFVTLIIVQRNQLRCVRAHWRTIQLLLQHGFEGAATNAKTWELDAGYIVMDLNTGLVLNEQDAFALKVPDGD